MYEKLGNPYYVADVLVHLGDTPAVATGTEAAREAWQSALAILEELGHPDAGRVRAKLRRLDARTGST